MEPSRKQLQVCTIPAVAANLENEALFEVKVYRASWQLSHRSCMQLCISILKYDILHMFHARGGNAMLAQIVEKLAQKGGQL
eukprot:5329510-Amphidinium_carterae.1